MLFFTKLQQFKQIINIVTRSCKPVAPHKYAKVTRPLSSEGAAAPD